MSKAISCGSCGGANIYEIGSSSINCEFCGTVVNIPNSESPSNRQSVESRIKFKPEITLPEKKKVSSVPYIKEQHTKVRVDDGWIIHFKNKPSKFYRDKYTYDYSNGGGVLKITQKEISSFREVFDWYTDIELGGIRVLDLSKNRIDDSYNFGEFNNLEEINFSSNNFKHVIFDFNLSNLKSINLSNNRITELSDKLVDINSKDKGDKLNINLSNNNISRINDGFISHIREIMKIYQKSLTINLKGNSIEIDRLVSEFPPKKAISIEELVGMKSSILGYIAKAKPDKKTLIKNYLGKPLMSLLIETDSKEIRHQVVYPSIEDVEKAYVKKYNEKPKYSGCFIATAAMGSYDHPQVMELRHFRDEWILKKKWGDSFVSWYYHYGAIAAKFIEKSSILKKLSYLIVVKPLVTFSRLMKKD